MALSAALALAQPKSESPMVDAEDVILSLGREGVFPPEFAQRFAGIAGFRNILIHEYLAVDPARVHHLLQTGLDDFRTFARHVAEYLKGAG